MIVIACDESVRNREGDIHLWRRQSRAQLQHAADVTVACSVNGGLEHSPTGQGCDDRMLEDPVHIEAMPFQRASYKEAIIPPRSRSHWLPVILATPIKFGVLETLSIVTQYGGEFVAFKAF